MSKTYRFRDEYRKSHFKNTEYDYSDKQRNNCNAKAHYVSERMAQQQADFIMSSIDLKTGEMYAGKTLRPYRCSNCKGYHLTSQAPRK